MIKLYDTPPEKYYEACITYNLIQYFRTNYGKKVYPFSITQIREKQLGFDFGYELYEGHIFLTQYKRPVITASGEFAWKIERNQLNALLKNKLKSFYVLPAFSEACHWYDALDKTHFIPAHMIYALLHSQSSSLIRETEHIFSAMPKRPYDPFGKEPGSVLKTKEQVTENDIMQCVLEATDENTLVYMIGG